MPYNQFMKWLFFPDHEEMCAKRAVHLRAEEEKTETKDEKKKS